MTVRVGINGFGRIGRNFCRAVDSLGRRTSRSSPSTTSTDTQTLAHLLKYDTILGRLPYEVTADRRRDHASTARTFKALAERDPAALPWGDLGVDVVIESTGFFTKADDGPQARRRPAPRRSSSPRRPRARTSPSSWASTTTTYDGSQTDHLQRVLHHQLPGADGQGAARQRSASSSGLMTTIHAYTQDQNLQDGPHKDLRRARAAAHEHRPDLAPAPPRRSAWCCRSSRASWTATRCGCRSRPARPPT